MTPPGVPVPAVSSAALRIAGAAAVPGVPAAPGADATAPGPFARRVRGQLDRRARRLEKLAARVRRGSAGDTIKELRIACRRIEAALRLWKPFLAPRERRRAQRALRALRRGFGPVRELDLHATLLRALSVDAPAPAGPAALAVAESLERRARRRLRTLAGRLRPKRVRAATADVRAAGRGLRRRVARHGDPLAPARRRLERFDHAIAAGLAASLSSGEPEALHALRLRVKKARYACECIGEGLGVTLGLEPLIALQQALGQLHDRHTLIERVGERIDRVGRRGDPGAGDLEALRAYLAGDHAAKLAALRREAGAGVLRIRMPAVSSASVEDSASETQAG